MPDALQRVIGLIGAALTLPIVAALGVAIRRDSPGPAIFRAVRVGAGGQPFVCYKLRTMEWSPTSSGPEIAVPDDPRITKVGRVLRRTRLDELPQLWNVALGQMRLVGPRPESPRFVNLSDPLHAQVYRSRPGITGLTQLAFADEVQLVDPADAERTYRETILPRKLALDADYLRRRSVALDLWILGQTVRSMWGHRPNAAAIEARR